MKKNMKMPWADSWYLDDDYAYFVPGNFDKIEAILKYSFQDDSYSMVCSVDELNSVWRPYATTMRVGNKIVILPDIESRIVVYDENTQSKYFIEIDDTSTRRLLIHKYFLLDNGDVCLFSRGLQKILILDSNVTYIREMISIANSQDTNAFDVAMIDNVIYAGDINCGKIYSLNITSNERIEYSIDNIESVNTLTFDGSKFWISSHNKEIYSWEIGERCAQVYQIGLKDFGIFSNDFTEIDTLPTHNNEAFFYKSYCLGDRVIFIPYSTNSIIVFDKNKGLFEMTNNFYNHLIIKECKSSELLMPFVPVYQREDRYLGLYYVVNGDFYEYDSIMNSFELKNPRFSGESFDVKHYNKIINEGDYIQLEEFVKGL